MRITYWPIDRIMTYEYELLSLLAFGSGVPCNADRNNADYPGSSGIQMRYTCLNGRPRVVTKMFSKSSHKRVSINPRSSTPESRVFGN